VLNKGLFPMLPKSVAMTTSLKNGKPGSDRKNSRKYISVGKNVNVKIGPVDPEII